MPSSIALSDAAFFLDFDGTLVRIADRPDQVELTDDVAALLHALIEATDGAVALVSGRGLDEIDALIAPLHLPVAGSHGIERRRADGTMAAAAARHDGLAAAIDALDDYARANGLLLERKTGGAALHFRSHPGLEIASRALADDLANGTDGVRVIHGHMVAELSLAGLDKGAALLAFMAESPFLGRIPVAVGDDTTDEDAIRAAQETGGIGIRIGDAPSQALVRLTDIDSFHHWLHMTVRNGTVSTEQDSA